MMGESTKLTAFVVDASYLLASLLPGEQNSEVDRMIGDYVSGKVRFCSVNLLPFEVLNGLKSAFKRKRISVDQLEKLGTAFLDWDIDYEEVKFDRALGLAVEEEISVYDASYLWLAISRGIRLLTLDEKLMGL